MHLIDVSLYPTLTIQASSSLKRSSNHLWNNRATSIERNLVNDPHWQQDQTFLFKLPFIAQQSAYH